MKTVKWYKYGVFWRRGDGDDDYSSQDRDDGVIDFIYNSATKYAKDRIFCEDAYRCFKQIARLLRQGKRFPDEFHSSYEVKFWWMYYIRKPLRKLRSESKLKPMYRSQFDMTRDPYKAFGALYAFLYRFADASMREELKAEFNSVRIPLRLQRGSIIKWWKRFKKDNRKHFVKRLSYWEDVAKTDWYLTNYEDNFYESTTKTT